MDTDALLRAHDAAIRKWAGLAARRHPITRDEAYGELRYGFFRGIATWRPDGGASLAAHCRSRAFWAVKDYCRSLSFTPTKLKSLVRVRRLAARDDQDEAGDLAAADRPELRCAPDEAAEFWEKAYNGIARHHPDEWLTLCLLRREGWSVAEAAKYFAVSERAVSQRHARALALLRESRGLRAWLAGERWGKPRVASARRRSGYYIPRGPECCKIGCHMPVDGRGKCAKHYCRDRRDRALAEARCRDD